MSKYLIVLDEAPKHCGECSFAVEGRCAVNNEFVLFEHRHNYKHQPCPIKMCTEMRAGNDSAETYHRVQGWMDCMRHHNML